MYSSTSVVSGVGFQPASSHVAARCRVLDELGNGVATANGLTGVHDQLNQLEAAVDKASKPVASGLAARILCCTSRHCGIDATAFKTAYIAFEEANLVHLTQEEDVMMPQVQAMAKAGVPLKKVMAEDLFPAVHPDEEEFFISHAMKTLEKHPQGMPRARVWAHALWSVSTPEQWAVRREYVRAAVSEDLFKEIDGLCTE